MSEQEDARGYAAIPVWMVRSPEIDSNVKLLFVILSSHQGVRGIFPSQKTLAHETGWSESTVKRTLSEMQELGFIEVRVERTAHGRRNNYRLLVDKFGGAEVNRDLGGEVI